MSIRIRKDGTMLCGAMSEPKNGDTYIDDNTQYYMHVMTGAIIASEKHDIDGLWFWNIKQDMVEHEKEIQKSLLKRSFISQIITSLQ